MKKTIFLLFFGILALSPAINAQSQPLQPPAQDTPIIRHTVQEIVLEVEVRDGKGKIVKNLKPGDLEVYENGAKQEIRSFKLIQGRDVVLKGKPALAGGLSATPANPLKAINLICIVFANLDPFTKKYAVDAVREFMKNQLEADTWVAVFSLESQLTVLHPFTTNRDEIMQAADQAFTGVNVDFASVAVSVLNATPLVEYMQTTANGQPSQGYAVSAVQKITGGGLNPKAIVGADQSNALSARIQRGEQAAERREFGGIEGMRETDQILTMMDQLSGLPGRKSVLLLSPGLAHTGDPDLFKKMVDKGIKGGITVYAIDVNGLSAEVDPSQASSTALNHAAGLSSTQGALSGSAAQQKEKMRQGDYIDDAVRTTDTQASLRALSEGTGGFLIGSTNDLRKPFQRVIEDVDTHYEVIYHPSTNQYDGHLRTIDVKAPARADLTIESQRGYFGLPVLHSGAELNQYEMMGLAALSVPQPPHAFEFKAAAYHFRPNTANTQNDVVFEIPASNLTATPEPDRNLQRMHLSLVSIVKDASGEVVDKFSKDAPYEIPEQNLAKARATSITFDHPLALAPGHYTMETAVLDREGNKASTSKSEFDSAERNGVGLSSILLVQQMEKVDGKVDAANPLEFQPSPTLVSRVVPELATDLGSTATPYAYFVVYPDPSITDKPKIQAEFLLNGQVLAKQTADLPPPDATGAIPMVINAAAKTGKCELRITAMQGGSSSKSSLTYSIAAK